MPPRKPAPTERGGGCHRRSRGRCPGGRRSRRRCTPTAPGPGSRTPTCRSRRSALPTTAGEPADSTEPVRRCSHRWPGRSREPSRTRRHPVSTVPPMIFVTITAPFLPQRPTRAGSRGRSGCRRRRRTGSCTTRRSSGTAGSGSRRRRGASRPAGGAAGAAARAAAGAPLVAAASTAATACAMQALASCTAALTPTSTVGLPANRSLPWTSRSAAKITPSAAAITAGSSGDEPAAPWVSTTHSWPAAAAACSSASAAM